VSQSAVGIPRTTRHLRLAVDQRSAASALGFGMIVLVGFEDGGYYARSWAWAGLALAVIAAIQLLVRGGVALSRLSVLSLAALVGLASWMALSAIWGIDGTDAWRESERAALYVAAVAALLAVTRSDTVSALLVGVLGGTTALAVVALAERVAAGPAPDPYEGTLLTGPVGYANALGQLMAVGVVLAIGLALERKGPIERLLLGGAAGASGVALALASSRGALLALLVGLVVLAAGRLRSRALIAAMALGTVVALLVALPRTSFGDRPAYWRVAVDDASEHALLGSGAGTFDDVWLERRPIPKFAQDAHSLYLETAAELGVVGLALLLCMLVAPLVAVVTTGDRTRVATAAAAYAVFLVHAGLDWDWEMPVTVLAGLACGAAVLIGVRRA
jgi:hypothetical protein